MNASSACIGITLFFDRNCGVGFPIPVKSGRIHANQGPKKGIPVQLKNLFIKAAGGLLFVFAAISALIFLPAWTLNYWQAWTFLGLFIVLISAIFTYLAKNDSNLLARRIQTTEKEKNLDSGSDLGQRNLIIPFSALCVRIGFWLALRGRSVSSTEC
jgi:hypothetical protein